MLREAMAVAVARLAAAAGLRRGSRLVSAWKAWPGVTSGLYQSLLDAAMGGRSGGNKGT
ncbi:MAG: hypothetical protein LBT71_01660 [Azoarcus sp.]|jgi:hypothetical protein|nr:hypothetical protein [Azoarcus sp.]